MFLVNIVVGLSSTTQKRKIKGFLSMCTSNGVKPRVALLDKAVVDVGKLIPHGKFVVPAVKLFVKLEADAVIPELIGFSVAENEEVTVAKLVEVTSFVTLLYKAVLAVVELVPQGKLVEEFCDEASKHKTKFDSVGQSKWLVKWFVIRNKNGFILK